MYRNKIFVGVVEVKLHTFYTSALDGSQIYVPANLPLPTLFLKEIAHTHWTGCWLDASAVLAVMKRMIHMPLPGIKPLLPNQQLSLCGVSRNGHKTVTLVTARK
jgi:hypothetical protein